MTNKQHHPEPWHIDRVPNDTFAITNASHELLGNVFPFWPESEANARRIVACINFCEGHSTEWLEARRLSNCIDG